jgi:hypothetical protein
MLATVDPDTAALRLAPRIAPQPSTLSIGPGQSKIWNVIGMDLDGLTSAQLVLHFSPASIAVTDVSLGSALTFDPAMPPSVNIDRTAGTITVKSTDGKPLTFAGGGEVLSLRVSGGQPGETFLIMDNPDLHTDRGQSIVAAVAGGRARVQ